MLYLSYREYYFVFVFLLPLRIFCFYIKMVGILSRDLICVLHADDLICSFSLFYMSLVTLVIII